jgi:chromosomal replication initiation ATPase DnaA
MESPPVSLQELVQTLNVQQLKSVLKLHSLSFTSKHKKEDLCNLVVSNNVSVEVVVNHLELNMDELTKKVLKQRKKLEKPKVTKVPKTPKQKVSKSPKKSKKETEPSSDQESEDLNPEELDDYVDSDE